MISELTVNVQPDCIQIAITEDHNLVEYQKESHEMSFSVGNMYLGRVKKLMPGLNACFVDIGSEKEAFLHYQDLGSQFGALQKYIKQVRSNRKKLYPFSKAILSSQENKDGNITTELEQGQEILVQITSNFEFCKDSKIYNTERVSAKNIRTLSVPPDGDPDSRDAAFLLFHDFHD